MKTKLKQIWKWLNGKKTTIATIVMSSTQLIQLVAPALIPVPIVNVLMIIGSALGGVGLFHKGIKTQAGQNLIHTKIKPKKK